MNTIEGNKLIAEFMGIDFVAQTSHFRVMESNWLDPYHHKFEQNWNHLMPVVEKIAYQCEEPEELDPLKYAMFTNNIEVAFEEVVDIIQNITASRG